MIHEQTMNTLHQLKLFGLARSFEERLKSAQEASLSHQEFVGLLVQDEKTYRENQRLKRLLKNARLKIHSSLEEIDYRTPRGLNKQTLLELGSPNWLESHRNVLLTGPTGVGKSFIACALGNFAARAGFTVAYFRAPRLFEILHQSKADGSHLKTLNKLAKIQILVLDDFLLTKLSDPERKDILEIIEDRYGSASTIIASQCPLKDWHPSIDDPTLADAICDRLFHNTVKIELKGESFRKKSAAPEKQTEELLRKQTAKKDRNGNSD